MFFLSAVIAFGQQKPVKTPQTTQKKTIVKTKGCVLGDCVDGWGKWVYNNGYYSGFFSNSKKSGYGLYEWNEAGKYVGWWENDQREGYGVYFYNEGDQMIGEFKNGELTGFGRNLKGGKWKQGVYKGGNLQTEHTFIDNKVEEGCIAGECRNKYGRYKWSNGDVFTGFFKYGNMYMGTYVFANGDKYNGMFNSQNSFHGQGRFFFKDGEYYGGNWSNGKYNGRGYYVDKDSKSQKGIWSDGKLTQSFD